MSPATATAKAPEGVLRVPTFAPSLARRAVNPPVSAASTHAPPPARAHAATAPAAPVPTVHAGEVLADSRGEMHPSGGGGNTLLPTVPRKLPGGVHTHDPSDPDPSVTSSSTFRG